MPLKTFQRLPLFEDSILAPLLPHHVYQQHLVQAFSDPRLWQVGFEVLVPTLSLRYTRSLLNRAYVSIPMSEAWPDSVLAVGTHGTCWLRH